MRVGMCVCVYDCWGVAHPSLLCRSSKRLHPTAEEGQCITKHRRTWCYVKPTLRSGIISGTIPLWIVTAVNDQLDCLETL